MAKPLLKQVLMLSLAILVGNVASSQDQTQNKFGKGIKIAAQDSSFTMKFSTRIQTRYDAEISPNASPNYIDRIYLRRARFKFDGWAFSPRLSYKIEYAIVSGAMLDAVLKWNFAGNFHLWFGQTKLPGNRERVISSQQLQFVDRSQLNSKYNIDRDKGIQLRHHFNVGKMLVREAIAISQGEGRNVKTWNEGYDYTGRVELLPFGSFTSKGDYSSSDLKREETPKLAIGVTYDVNDKAMKSGGQLGSTVSENRNLASIFADFMFKYKGLSIMGEYANKWTNGSSPAILDSGNVFVESYYTGQGYNAQLGYLFKSNWELAGRYTHIVPEKETLNPMFSEYTFGISRYIVGHSLKVQTDFTLHTEESADDLYIFRLQAELAF